tara:strand:+ start:366 stop:1370 length:1005 start_codon:yes stop_codon:yes gene_type:complete
MGLQVGYRRQYQIWRMLDHLLGTENPAKRFSNQRNKIINSILTNTHLKPTNGEIKQVERIQNYSPKNLKQHYLKKGTPIIIEGAAKEWNCVKKWSLDWLYENYCNDEVAIFDPLNSQTDQINYQIEQTTLKMVIEAMKKGDSSKYSRFNRILYDHPELINDFDWKWLYKMRNQLSSGKTFQVFIGGKGTNTSLHCAAEHNLFTQVYGEKHWYFFAPKNDIFLDPPITKSPYFYSKFNPEKPDFNEFPAANHLTTWECILKPGDVLFNPPFWWHQVKNISHSIGVGFRWFSPMESIKSSLSSTLLTLLSTNPSILTATKHRTNFARIFKYMNNKQ